MRVQQAVRRAWSRYATFSGRASRPEFWWWTLAFFLLMCVTQLIDGLLIAPALGIEQPWSDDAGQPLSLVAALVFLLPNLAVAVRRLHDINRTGWWLLIGVVPLVGVLVLIYFYVQRSDRGSNDFGEPDPLMS